MDEWIIKVLICFVIGVIGFVPIMIAWHKKKKRLPIRVHEDGYVMYSSRGYITVLAICPLGIFFLMGLLVYALSGIALVCVSCLFLVLMLVYTSVLIDTLLWWAVVEADIMTVYNPFFPIKKFNICEISKVKEFKSGITYNRMVGYVERKKVFEVDRSVIGFDQFCEQLYYAGKLKPIEIKENFTVRISKSDIVGDIFGIVVFGACLSAAIIMREEITIIFIIGVGFLSAKLLIDIVNKVLWKVTVNYDSICVRNKFGIEKSYLWKEITMVQEWSGGADLFVGNKRIVKVATDNENYTPLMVRLSSLGIRFCYKEG